MASLSLKALCFLPFLFCHVTAIYTPLREYAGSTFFDRWSYYGNVDNTTWGNVTYQDQANATSKGLTFVNGAGHAIVKVDNTTTLLPGPLVNRDSIRLTSLDSYGIGSLIIIDAVHIPYGCSVWPSFWTYGIEQEWPLGSEIDIIEGINGMSNNQVALHTTQGCYQAQNPGQTGVTLDGDCSTDRGCIVTETKPNSYGAGFAAAGGGAYAIQMAASGIYSWFWSRPDIPDNVKLSTSTSLINTTVWGLPSSAYPASACNITQYFPPQNLVLLTTLCGVWAGVPDIYRSTCQTPTNSCVTDNVIGPGNTFDTAYWEIRFIRTYLADDAPPISSSSVAPSSTTNVPITTTSTTTAPSSTTHHSSSTPLRLSHLTLSCFVLLSVMTLFPDDSRT